MKLTSLKITHAAITHLLSTYGYFPQIFFSLPDRANLSQPTLAAFLSHLPLVASQQLWLENSYNAILPDITTTSTLWPKSFIFNQHTATWFQQPGWTQAHPGMYNRLEPKSRACKQIFHIIPKLRYPFLKLSTTPPYQPDLLKHVIATSFVTPGGSSLPNA